MSGNPSHGGDERSRLLNAMAEESLTGDEERRLAELLRTDAAFRREYVRFCELLTQLTWESSGPHEPPGPSVRTTGSEIAAHTERKEMPQRRRFRLWVASLGAAIAVSLLAMVWFGPLRPAPGSPGSVTGVSGQVEVVRGDQPPIALRIEDVAREDWPLQQNDRIRTDPGGSATVTLSDGTKLRMGPATDLIVGTKPDANVIVSRGSVAASVTPQPARQPMTFVTPGAAVRVLGTELELLAHDERTEVAVTEGRVRVTRTSDQASIEVAAAQFVVVDESGPLSVVDWPQPPDVWSEDFEDRPPAGWTGRFVREGLPGGSRGGLQAVGVSDARGRSMELGSPIEEHGLFAWHADSVLHLTFRVQPPAWFHVCLFSRTYQRSKPLVAWCRIDPDLWQARPGEWRTVRIPLAAFHLVGFEQKSATLGRIPLRLAFVGPGDLPGLVIDDIRVDRSGKRSEIDVESDLKGDQP